MSCRGATLTPRRGERLTADEREQLKKIIARMGQERASSHLGSTITTLLTLVDGLPVKAIFVERIRERLAAE